MTDLSPRHAPPTVQDLFRLTGEDPRYAPEIPFPPGSIYATDNAPPPGEDRQAVCLRTTPRQATSAVAWVGAEPEEDDPLLCFVPYLHPAPRANSITPERQVRFIATLAATGIVNQAARSIGKSVEALYKLKAKPGAEGFAAAWEAAVERGTQRLEDCALERAIRGTPTPIVSGGKLLGTWDKPDNGMLRFLLQHRRSERYGAQQVRPGHPLYESIRKEVEKELGKRTLADECATISSINAKIDRMRVSSDVMQMFRDRAEVEEALDDMGLRQEEIWPIPLPEGADRSEEAQALWLRWQNPGIKRHALEEEGEC